jgi:chromosome partitioning related protein ParA
MQVNSIVSIVSSKGGVGKTTTSANLGGIAADAGLKTLLIDLDGQPTLSSYFPLEYQAPGGTFDLLVHSNTTAENIISRTNIPGLDIILSNDPHNQLETLLLHAPDGRLRLRSLLKRLPAYDLVIIDTKGTSAVTVEMALVASDLALSPLVPEMLSAREFSRGTLALFASVDRLRQSAGFGAPPLHVVFNRQDNTNDARIISANIRELMGELVTPFHVLNAAIPALLTYRLAASEGVPAHRLEPSNSARQRGRKAPLASDTLKAVASELWPEWKEQFARV